MPNTRDTGDTGVTGDMIWIEEAAKQYGRSRVWLKQQVDASKLSYATIAGDKKLYLLRSELAQFFRPQVTPRREDDDHDNEDAGHKTTDAG